MLLCFLDSSVIYRRWGDELHAPLPPLLSSVRPSRRGTCQDQPKEKTKRKEGSGTSFRHEEARRGGMFSSFFSLFLGMTHKLDPFYFSSSPRLSGGISLLLFVLFRRPFFFGDLLMATAARKEKEQRRGEMEGERGKEENAFWRRRRREGRKKRKPENF